MEIVALIEEAIRLALEVEQLISDAVSDGKIDHDVLRKHRAHLRALREAKLRAAGGTP